MADYKELYNAFIETLQSIFMMDHEDTFGGAKWIGQNYINIGQNTIYFKKWDVVANVNSASGNNFDHQ